MTQSQREWRRRSVGASEVPALFVPEWYKTAGDIYLEKIGAIDDMDQVKVDDGDSPILIGSVLEFAIIRWAKERIGVKRGRKNVRRKHKYVHMAATLDYQIIESNQDGLVPCGIPLEIKTTGIMGHSRFSGEWGKDGTDEIPTPVMLQVQAQMACCGASKAYVAALIAFRGLALYEVYRSDPIVDAIENRVEDFWVNHVLSRRPPPNATLETLSQVARSHAPGAVVRRDLVDMYQEIGSQIRELEKKRKELKEWIVRSLSVDGEYVDRGQTEDEWWDIEYPLIERAARVVPPSRYRTLRIKKGPAQKMMESIDGTGTDAGAGDRGDLRAGEPGEQPTPVHAGGSLPAGGEGTGVQDPAGQGHTENGAVEA